jgi:hypothetical protein
MSTRPQQWLAVIAALSLCNLRSPGQTTTSRELPQITGASAAVYDRVRQRTWFAVPGRPAQLFEWDGTTARLRPGELDTLLRVSALGRAAATGDIHALGFDLQDRLVHGVHDGCRWSWQVTQQFFQPLSFPPIAYDEQRGRFVVYLSQLGSGSQVAEFDGANWTVSPQLPLPWRSGPAFAYDPIQNHCVLFGGADGQGPRDDVWRWTGTQLVPLATNPGPGPRQSASFGYSAAHGGLVLYGDAQLGRRDTWVLAGTTWTQLPTPQDAGPFAQPVLVEDGIGLALVGQHQALLRSGRRLVGNLWSPVDNLTAPTFRQNAAVGFDRRRGELVVFGGTTENSEVLQVFDGRWRQRQPAVAPSRRSGAAFAWSAIDGALLLLGGTDANGPCTDTWSWDGTAWQQRAAAPPARSFATLAADPSGGVMLYGGFAGTVRADHWLWNGSSWQQVAATAAPGGVFGALAAFDEARRRTVLLGNFASGVRTWEWDGVTWTLADTSTHPALSSTHRMAYDPGRSQVVTVQPGCRAWTGSSWQVVPLAGAAPSPQALVSDSRRIGLLALGAGSPMQMTLLTTRPAVATAVGTPCATGEPPALSTLELPELGRADFALTLGSKTPGTPCLVWFGTGGPGAIGPCAIVTAPLLDAVFAVTNQGGTAVVPLPIPDDRTLLGLGLIAQAAVYEPLRSRIGSVTLSAGLQLAIGR